MRGRRAELKSIEGGLTGLAPKPAHIPKSMQQEWDRVVADLSGRKLLTTSMLGIVAAYVTAQYQIAECVKAIEADGAFTRSRTGEPKAHPAHGIMNKAGEIVARLGAELGLTPAARSRKALQGNGDDGDEGAPAGLDL
jgi:P27 family predicted phage terminase small subunit